MASDTETAGWLRSRLAGHPGIVVIVSAGGAALLTAVFLIASSLDAAAVVSLLATLWGLLLALAIYLLTAFDTDRVLNQIDDLKEQLSAALAVDNTDASPVEASQNGGAEAEQTVAPSEPEPVDQPTGVEAPDLQPLGGPAKPQAPIPQRPDKPQRPQRQERQPSARPQWSTRSRAMTEPLPESLVAVWTESSGLSASDIARWIQRGSPGHQLWVIESTDGRYWSVFDRGRGKPSVVALDDRRRGRQGNSRRDQRQRWHGDDRDR